MRKGNGLKLNGHDYGILFCGTDGSLMLDRERYEIIPDKTILPYGISSVHGDRPLRKIDLKPEKAKGVDGQPAHVKNFLECLQTRALPTCDIEIGHRSTNTCHLGNIAYKLGRKLDWDDDDRDVQGRLARPTPCSRASRARVMSCPTSERSDLEISHDATHRPVAADDRPAHRDGRCGRRRPGKGGQASSPRSQVPGARSSRSAWVAVVLGFVIWLIARILLAAARPSRGETQ